MASQYFVRLGETESLLLLHLNPGIFFSPEFDLSYIQFHLGQRDQCPEGLTNAWRFKIPCSSCCGSMG